VKTCVAAVEAQEKGKTRNVAGAEALRKNESQFRFAVVNS